MVSLSEENKIHSAVFASLGKGVEVVDLDSLVPKNYSIDKEDVYDALNKGDIATLRMLSTYFYGYSGVYRQLIHKMAGICKHRFTLTPLFYLTKSDKFNEKIDKEVIRYVENSKIEQSAFHIDFLAIMHGACYVYETVMDNAVIQQVLPASACRSRRLDEFGNRIVEFDFSYFDRALNGKDSKEVSDFWKTMPSEFMKLYKMFKANKSNCGDARNVKWQQLDSAYARAYYASNDAAPFFCTIFPEILEAEDLKTMDSEQAKQKLFKLIVQRFKLDEDGEPVSDDGQILQSHANLRKAVDGAAQIYTTGFELQSLSLKDGNSGATSEIKYQELGDNRMYSDLGLQQSVMGSTQQVGAQAIKSSNILVGESLKMLRYAHENWYAKTINTIANGRVVYSFKMLDVNVFNESEFIKNAKTQLDIGGSIQLFYSAIGIPIHVLKDMMRYEDHLKVKELFVPLVNSNQMAGDVGAPKKDTLDKASSTLESDQNRS